MSDYALLTVRISDEEKALLAERAKKAGVTSGELVRQLLNDAPLTTADELIAEMSSRLGDSKLRVRRKK